MLHLELLAGVVSEVALVHLGLLILVNQELVALDLCAHLIVHLQLILTLESVHVLLMGDHLLVSNLLPCKHARLLQLHDVRLACVHLVFRRNILAHRTKAVHEIQKVLLMWILGEIRCRLNRLLVQLSLLAIHTIQYLCVE